MTFLGKIAVWCAVLCAACLPVLAEDVVVPMDVQVALFTKIWKLDRTFKPGPIVTVGVIYQQEYRPSANVATQLVTTIRAANLPIQVTLIDLDEQATLPQRIPLKGFDVFYVTPLRAIDVRTIAAISRAHGIKTITGVPAYVEQGLAVGMGLLKQRPLIIINLKASRAEGSEFRAQLLKLSRVIEDGGAAYGRGGSE
jgi:hypothetical protein